MGLIFRQFSTYVWKIKIGYGRNYRDRQGLMVLQMADFFFFFLRYFLLLLGYSW